METRLWYARNGELIGLIYGAFNFLGITIGSLVGFLAGGGVSEFLNEGWILTIVGFFVGAMIGTGLGLLGHGMVVVKRR